MNHHQAGMVCPLCEDKLEQAHPFLRDWFRRVKTQYPDVHVSWSYRDQAAQEAAFKEGMTKLHYPNSAHNVTKDGVPCAMALDLFQIEEDGIATFSPIFYLKLADQIAQSGEPIFWGGRWTHLGDRDHFQYRPTS